jgi:hypothetical protein
MDQGQEENTDSTGHNNHVSRSGRDREQLFVGFMIGKKEYQINKKGNIIMLKKETKNKVTDNKTNKKSTRTYMYSYEWNYMVLEIVDYLETRFAEIESSDSPNIDPWKIFKDYCSQNDLNWRVIRKMIEFFINTPFESERELASHESFKALEKVEDEPVTVLETKRPESAKERLVDLFLD